MINTFTVKKSFTNLTCIFTNSVQNELVFIHLHPTVVLLKTQVSIHFANWRETSKYLTQAAPSLLPLVSSDSILWKIPNDDCRKRKKKKFHVMHLKSILYKLNWSFFPCFLAQECNHYCFWKQYCFLYWKQDKILSYEQNSVCAVVLKCSPLNYFNLYCLELPSDQEQNYILFYDLSALQTNIVYYSRPIQESCHKDICSL